MEGSRLRPSSVILLVVGIVSVGIGFGFVAVSALPQSRTTSFALPMGLYYYTYLRFETLAAGSITVTYQASPGAVYQYVLTQAQYAVFQTHATTDTLFATSGSNGSFTASLPSSGTYYLVTTHASGYEFTPQTGTHSTTLRGVAPTPFYAAVIAFATGVALLVIGLWLRTKPARTVPKGYAPYPSGGWGPLPPGSPINPSQVAYTAPAFGGAPVGYGTVLVTLENASTAETNVQLFVNGSPVTSVLVPAGRTAQATIHPALPNPYGTRVHLEAVAADGRRATQDVTATAFVGISVGLRVQ